MATVKAYVRSSKKNNIVNVRFRLSTPGAKIIILCSRFTDKRRSFRQQERRNKNRGRCTRIKKDEFSTKK